MLQQYRVAVSTPETLLNNNTCGEAPENFNHIFRPASDPNYPWPGVLIGANILSYWYFCTDQVRGRATPNKGWATPNSSFVIDLH